MSNAMTAHEPINYLDSILNEEETRCEYSHQWRNFSISRSGRFKSKNKKRDIVDGKLFDANATSKDSLTEQEKISSKAYHHQQQPTIAAMPSSSVTATARSPREKKESYKSFYETNL